MNKADLFLILSGLVNLPIAYGLVSFNNRVTVLLTFSISIILFLIGAYLNLTEH